MRPAARWRRRTRSDFSLRLMSVGFVTTGDGPRRTRPIGRVERAHVGQIERAQASMTITVLGRIANALEVEAAKLVARPRSRQ